MADQPTIRDVVLRCRDCKRETPAIEPQQVCVTAACRYAQTYHGAGGYRWSGWEIAHITRAEAA